MIVPKETNYAKHVYHVYAVRVRNRDSLIGALSEKNIHCGIHYPIPVHLQEAYHFLGLKRGCFPVAESCALEFVSLPMFPELSKQQIDYVSSQILRFKEK